MAPTEGTQTRPVPGRPRPPWVAEAFAGLSAVVALTALAGGLARHPVLGGLGRGFVPLAPL